MSVIVAGAGNWGRNVVRTLSGLGALAGVAEPDPALRRAALAGSTARPFTSLEEALAAGGKEAIAIATPAATHARMAQRALEADRDVFVEKPMALTPADAQGLVELAQERDRILMVGHMLLYQPAVAWLVAAIREGRIGRLRSVHLHRRNLGTVRTVENALWSLGVHDVAVLLACTQAEPEAVQAHGQRVLQPDIEDDVHLHLRFPDGVQGHLHVSWLWPTKDRGLTAVGSDGMLSYDEGTQEVILHQKSIGPDLAPRDAGSTVAFRGSGEPLREELAHFLHCVRTRERPLSDGRNGLQVVRVLAAAQEALSR